MNGLAQRLKEARKQSGLSQEKLAEAIGVSGHAIYLFERGKNRPALDTLERIAAGHRAGYRVVLRRRLCRPGRRPRADLECHPEPAPASTTTVDTGADLATTVAQVETEG